MIIEQKLLYTINSVKIFQTLGTCFYHYLKLVNSKSNGVEYLLTDSQLSRKGKTFYLPIFGNTTINATVFTHVQLRFLIPGRAKKGMSQEFFNLYLGPVYLH